MAAETETKTNAGAKKESESDRGLLRLWAGLLVAPLAFLLNLQVNYTLTQKLCPGGPLLILHLMTLCFLLLAAGGAFIAWREWERAGRKWPDEAADRTTRNRFMGAVGLLMSVLFFLIIVAQWIPQFIFSPCQR